MITTKIQEAISTQIGHELESAYAYPGMVRVQDAEQLRYLGSLDLYPGARVEVVECAPFEGPISLTVNGAPRVLSRALADQIHIAPVADADGELQSSLGQPNSPPDERPGSAG